MHSTDHQVAADPINGFPNLIEDGLMVSEHLWLAD